MTNNMKKLLLIILLHAVCLLSCNIDLAAQNPPSAQPDPRRNVISGQFELQTGAKQRDPYESSLESAVAFLERLQTQIKALAAGQVSKFERLDDNAVNFLTAAYLLCSINTGVCAYFLESLLEADVINSRIERKNSCINLRLFWRRYLDSDMETRHQHHTRMGFFSQTGEFNQKVRPKFIRCQDTVKAEIAGSMSDSDFFRQRYSEQSRIEAVNKTLEYINNLKSKNINVFHELSNLRR